MRRRPANDTLLVAAAVLLLAALGVGLFVLPNALVSGLRLSGADLAKAESDTRGNLVAAWTGLAIGLAGIGTYLTYRLNRRGQVTDRFGKAIDQLGHQSLAVQTGALYTLEQIVCDSRELHWPVMEVLFAYLNASAVRDRTGAPPISYPVVVGDDLQKQVKALSLPSNVQAALTIIGRRDASRDAEGGVLNLKNLDLGDARLDGASLAARSGRPARVNLRHAHLAGAHLRGAHLAYADLTDALLIDANLKGADLTGARLARADLRLVHLDGVKLNHADLSGADLRSVKGLVAAQLTEACWDARTRWPAGLVPPASPCPQKAAEPLLPTRATTAVDIRDATDEDLPATLAIYNQLVADTTVIWSDRPETLDERRAWVSARRARGFPVLVAADRHTGEVVGTATYSDFRDSRTRRGYQFTVEHSIHVRRDLTGTGIGAVLLDELVERARAAGVHMMVGGADGDNEGSIRFHQRHGFVETARMPEVGHKFGRWLDLVLFQRVIGNDDDER